MRRNIIILCLAFIIIFSFSCNNSQHSLVWIIKSDNSKVYLAASMHCLSESDYPLNKRIMNAYNETDVFMIHVNFDSLTTNKNNEITFEHGELDSNKILEDILDENDIIQVKELIAEFGSEYEKWHTTRPTYLGDFIYTYNLMKYGYSLDYNLDYYLFELAKKEKKEIQFILETDEYMKIYKSKKYPDRVEKSMMKSYLSKIKEINTITKTSKDIWNTGDLIRLKEIRYADSLEYPLLYEYDFEKGNETNKIINLLNNNKDYFIALHINTILQILKELKQSGYTVIQV